MLSKFKFYLPLLFFFMVLGLLAQQVIFHSSRNNELPSALINHPLPSFVLSCFIPSNQLLISKELRGRALLVNVWATWCPACRYEHGMLMKIKKRYHVPIYGIAYKDNREAVVDWLQKNGNPFVAVGNDAKGDVAIDLGVYGAPETFVISPKGEIVYRYVGMIDEKTWNNILYPIIKKYGKYE